jgi:hypothetical protein
MLLAGVAFPQQLFAFFVWVERHPEPEKHGAFARGCRGVCESKSRQSGPYEKGRSGKAAAFPGVVVFVTYFPLSRMGLLAG